MTVTTPQKGVPVGSAFDANRFVRRRSTYVYPISVTTTSMGIMIFLSGLAGLGDASGSGLHDGVAFVIVGATAAVLGLVLSRYVRLAKRISSREAMGVTTVVWCTMIAISSVAYLVSGELHVEGALFESASGLTTTGMTVLADPAQASATLLIWRAVSQWMGGLGVLIIGFGLLPLFGGAYRLRGGKGRPGPSGTLGTKFGEVVRRVALLYTGFSVVMFVAYLAAGAPSFDAWLLSLTTVSTGGFTTRAGSFKLYDSAALEWVAIVGMAIAGSSIAIWWWALSGSSKRAFRSVQLRSYLGLLVVVSAVASVVNGGDADDIRRTIFTVVSYSSTTGFEVVDAGTWSATLDALLFSLMVIGAMSGSAGGGLHISRVRLLLLYLRRVLVQQVHPASVVHVKANGKKVDEYIVTHMVSVAALYLALGLVGSIGIATFGGQLHLSFIAAVSALSNVGPIFGVDATLGAVSSGGVETAASDGTNVVLEMGGPARFVLAGLMIAGRLGVYPALVALGDLIGPVYAKTKWATHAVQRRRSYTGDVEW